MTKTYFPFDSGAGSASYETSWRKMAKLWRPSGPINGQLNGLQAYADSTGMQVKVKTGLAWIEGFYFETDLEYTLAIATADGTNPRIDLVVLRLDMSANTVDFGILTGTPAASPAVPSVTQGATIYEIALAQVRVDAAVVTIAAGKVTDSRTISLGAWEAELARDGRLTLTSGTPVTSGDVLAATSLYFTPYLGSRVSLYDTTALTWRSYQFSELSLSLAGYTASKNYDIYLANVGGILTLESAIWTSDTVRATALVLQDGRYVKTGDATHLFLGTIRTTAVTGQTEDSKVNRFVANFFNNVRKNMGVDELTSHNYNGATRLWNGSSTNNLLSFVNCIANNASSYSIRAQIATPDGTGAYVLQYLNGSALHSGYAEISNSNAYAMSAGSLTEYFNPVVGLNTLQVYENGNNATSTFSNLFQSASVFC